MDKKTFYGTDEETAISYLEFGSIDLAAGKKNVWDFRLHDKAYDWLMLARYSNDMVTYVNMKEKLGQAPIEDIANIYDSEVHHKNDASLNLGKLCALAVMKNHQEAQDKPLSFFELGQTIFGCIEGMEFYQELLKHTGVDIPNIDFKKMSWYGVDISQFFNKLAVLMHEKYNVKTMDELSMLPPQADVFFSKGVTLLYAVRNASQLIEILEKGRLCIFDYSFSLGDNQEVTIGSGKLVKYLDYKDFDVLLKQSNKKAYVRKNKSYYTEETNSVFLDMIFAEEPFCNEFISMDVTMRNALQEKLVSPRASECFLDLAEGEKTEWVPLDSFIDSIMG